MKTISLIKTFILATLFIFASCQEEEINGIVCPEISIETSIVDTNYTFQASGHDATTLANYSWSINGEYIETGNFDGSNNEYFSYNFTENGTYTVCAFIETPECPNGVEYCEEITINNTNSCPEISLEGSTVDTNYTFQASGHDATTTANYSWSINGEYIETGNFDGSNNEYFSYDFTENGIYTICVSIETPECPNGVEYCEEITITNNNACPEISLEGSTVDTNYTFQASGHDATITANYSWSINGEYIETGNFDGSNNEYFSYNFTENGTYTVCVSIETPECPNGVEHCEEITITSVNPCPEVSFETLIEDTNYTFQALGHDATTTANYSWSIDGDYIENLNFDGNNNEYFSYNFTENGTYTICAFIETPECPNGVEYCEEITIGNINPCPELSLEILIQDNGYRFQAFGHDSTTTANYSWSINGEYIQNGNFDGNNNEYFSYNFTESGTYTVCVFIETPECPNGVEYCTEVNIE